MHFVGGAKKLFTALVISFCGNVVETYVMFQCLVPLEIPTCIRAVCLCIYVRKRDRFLHMVSR